MGTHTSVSSTVVLVMETHTHKSVSQSAWEHTLVCLHRGSGDGNKHICPSVNYHERKKNTHKSVSQPAKEHTSQSVSFWGNKHTSQTFTIHTAQNLSTVVKWLLQSCVP